MKRIRRREVAYLGIVVSTVICVLAIGCAGAPAEKEVLIKITGHMPVGHHNTVACEEMIAEAEENSGGTLKFEYYPAGQLYKDMRAFEAVQSGEIEMAQFFMTRVGGLIPEGNCQMPWFDDIDHHARRMFDPDSGGGFFYSMLQPLFAEEGVQLILGPLYGPESSTITTKPVRTMEDYEGLKIRVNGVTAGGAVSAWGAKAVVMSSSDVYMAIQRGTVDGGASGLTTFRSRKWLEVADYVQLFTLMGPETLYYLANPDFLDSLSPNQEEVLKNAIRSTTIWCWEEAIAAVGKDVAYLEEAGLDVYEFPPDEYEKIVNAGLEGLEKVIKPTMSEASWNEHMRTYNDTKDGTRTWRELLETCALW